MTSVLTTEFAYCSFDGVSDGGPGSYCCVRVHRKVKYGCRKREKGVLCRNTKKEANNMGSKG